MMQKQRRLPTNRPPSHPGEILHEMFLSPLNITQGQLAKHLGYSRPGINAIINGNRALTPEMACKLADAFNTSVELWLGLQSDYDLWHAKKAHKKLPSLTA
jgi:addiction module HigA family antidote